MKNTPGPKESGSRRWELTVRVLQVLTSLLVQMDPKGLIANNRNGTALPGKLFISFALTITKGLAIVF